jgi:predicted nucleotidyltransferase
MEDIKNRITERNYHFLKKFENYIGVKLIFFGSVKRCDYFEENSDIDIAIISDNVQDTLTKIKFFLDLNNSKIRKIFQKFPNNNNDKNKSIVYGYKTNYNDYCNNLSLEIILYDEKYRNQVMESVNNINNFPFYITYFLILIKLFYYKFNLISSETYKWFKNILMENYLNQDLHDNLIAIEI